MHLSLRGDDNAVGGFDAKRSGPRVDSCQSIFDLDQFAAGAECGQGEVVLHGNKSIIKSQVIPDSVALA